MWPLSFRTAGGIQRERDQKRGKSMKKVAIVLFTVIFAACAFFSLSNIGNSTVEYELPAETAEPMVPETVETPTPVVTPTPEPTPTPVPSMQIGGMTVYETDTSVDLSAAASADIAAALPFIKTMSALQTINVGSNYDALGLSSATELIAATDAVLTGSVTIYGRTVDLSTESLDFNNISIGDGGTELRNILPVMGSLHEIYVENCGLSNETLGQFQQDFPAIDFIWRIYFGAGNAYSCLTNNETILASKPSVYGYLTNENAANLRYCTRVKNLDLGHNSKLTECSFISYMPDLEVCILTCTAVNSLEPFRGCSKLILLEIGDANVTDLSPLADCTTLTYLNVGMNKGLTTFAPLYNLKNLRKLSIGGTGDALNTVSELEAALADTDCVIIKDLVYIDSSGSYTATEGMWRYDRMIGTEENWKHAQETGVGSFVNSENYSLAREAFNYDAGSAAYCTEANGF